VRPEPASASLGERARRLVARTPAGALATLWTRRPGHPFASLMPYAADGLGRPLLLISGLAVHTRNLEADPRASLLVADARPGTDPLAAERVTLLGDARRLAAMEVDEARGLYLARHPDAAAWVDFGDFAFWRLELADVYMVGGFGVMGWVTAEAYSAAPT
jgi:heme oxygenase (biliverdin-IX-beta and delta-forming)